VGRSVGEETRQKLKGKEGKPHREELLKGDLSDAGREGQRVKGRVNK